MNIIVGATGQVGSLLIKEIIGKDFTAVFAAGGGSYSFSDSVYTEHLEYCTDRAWEGNDFTFTVSIKTIRLLNGALKR